LRATRIELAYHAWEARILPLNYARQHHANLLYTQRVSFFREQKKQLIVATVFSRASTENSNRDGYTASLYELYRIVNSTLLKTLCRFYSIHNPQDTENGFCSGRQYKDTASIISGGYFFSLCTAPRRPSIFKKPFHQITNADTKITAI
jgi:hypothetical protein